MSLPPHLPRILVGVLLGTAIGLPARAQQAENLIDPLIDPQIGALVAPLGDETNLFNDFSQNLDTASVPLRGDVSPAATLVLEAPLVAPEAAGTGTRRNAQGRPDQPLAGARQANGGPTVNGDFNDDLVDIRQRQRPELDPLGIRAGSFTFFPEISTRTQFTDNVTRALTDKKSDMLYAVSPSLRVQSNWGRHALSFRYTGDYGAYVDTSSEKIESTGFVAGGRIDFSRADRLTLRASFASDLEERDNVDVTGAVTSPGTVTRYEGQADYQHRFNRLSVNLRGNYAIEKYGESKTATGTQNNSDRDFNEAGTGLRLSYDVSPAARLFVDGLVDWRTYQNVPSGDVDRTSTGLRGAVGLRLAPARRLRGEVSLGYVYRDYRDGQLDAVDGVVVDANLAWLATPLTTVVVSAGSEVEETTLTGASALLTRRLGVGVAHELRRNLVVSADLGYERQSYEGANQSSSKIIATLGANYQVSRNAALTLTGVYEDELARQGDGQYVENTVTLGLVLRR